MAEVTLSLGYYISLAEKLGKPAGDIEKWARNELKLAKDEEEERIKRRNEEEEKKKQADFEREEKRKQADFEREEKKRQDDFERQQRLENRNVNKEGTNKLLSQKPKVSFAHFNDREERIDSFLHVFEAQARTLSIPENEWNTYLMPLLSGKARDVFLELSSTDLTYAIVKEALLKRYQLTADSYRKKFHSTSMSRDEDPEAFVSRLDILFTKWIEMSKVKKDYVGLYDLLLRHRILDSAHPDLVAFIQERNPKSTKEMSDLMRQYKTAHPDKPMSKTELPYVANISEVKTTFPGKPNPSIRFRSQSPVDRYRHRSQSPRVRFNVRETSSDGSNYNLRPRYRKETQDARRQSPNQRWKFDLNRDKNKRLVCWACNREGHIASECRFSKHANVAMHQSWRRQDTIYDSTPTPGRFVEVGCTAGLGTLDDFMHNGFIFDKPIRLLRDSGCNTTGVLRTHVPDSAYTGNTISCMTFGGRTEIFDEAVIELNSPFYVGTVKACVLDKSCADFVLGNIQGYKDCTAEELHDWNIKHGFVPSVDPKMIARHFVPLGQHELEVQEPKEVISQAVTTRGQARRDTLTEPVLKTKGIDIDFTTINIKELQGQDKSLNKYEELISSGNSKVKYTKSGSYQFVKKDGILYRIFSNKFERFEQLLIPECMRPAVLAVAHDTLCAGHLGHKRTLARLQRDMYWPAINKDTREYCKSCEICQKTKAKGKTPRVPMQKSIPIVPRKPFQKVAIDLIGPIHPVSDRGNRFALTLICTTTRWAEAIPLKETTTEMVAEALLSIFARIGFPAEVLSDGGPQLTSSLMKSVMSLIGIRQIHSTPYHQQSNGLNERWNQHIKQMIKRIAHEEPTQWDRYLPALLFAYREVPQETTGFSPFELVYGCVPRGPLSLIKDLCTKPTLPDDVKVDYNYVIDLRKRLDTVIKIANERTDVQSIRSKERYDKSTKDRYLEKGDQVLIFLPTGPNKIVSEWKGPYEVSDRKSPVNYEISIDGKKKVYHINMLQSYHTRPKNLEIDLVSNSCVALLAGVIPDEEEFDELLQDIVPSLESTESYEDVKLDENLSVSQKAEIKNLIKEFKTIFTDVPGETDLIEHEIKLNSQRPVKLPPYRLPFNASQVVKKEVKDMLKLGVIEPSTSAFCSPICLVPKDDGKKVRFCIDFRKLNEQTVDDAEPIPDTEQLFVSLKDARYFSKLDLAKGYWQIPLNEESKQYSSFTTEFGLFQFTRMPFGLKTAPQTFQRMMRKLFGDRDDVVFFFDDVTIFHNSFVEHIDALAEIFALLKQHNLTVRPTKVELGCGSVSFLGHIIGAGLLKPLPRTVSKILNIDIPKNKKQVKSLLGLVSYYSKFVPHLSTIVAPLSDLTIKGKPDRVQWDSNCQNALELIKEILSSDPVLAMPDFSKTFILQTDASAYGIGGALLQKHGEFLHPICFVSRKLLPREQRYSIIERECLGIVWSVSKLGRYLYGRKFLLQTDHRPLKYLQSSRSANGRLARWTLALCEYSFEVQYIKGSENLFADLLSRL